MLHLLLGTDWTANRDEVMKRIAADIAGDRSRAAGLSHDSIFTHDDFSFLLCSVSAFILLQMQ